RATKEAMKRRVANPLFCGQPCLPIPDTALRLFGSQVAYVEHIDMAQLNAVADEHNLRIHLLCQPGTFATPARPLLAIEGEATQAVCKALLAAMAFSDARSIENDPRYGLVILSEIAQRAMSPAVNDPGTCINVIATCVRLLCFWAQQSNGEELQERRHERVHASQLDVRDMFEDVFTPLARDAAGSLGVNIRLQKAFAALAQSNDEAVRHAARFHSQQALERALLALNFEADRQSLRVAALEVKTRQTVDHLPSL
ncbi:DUF2254 family protein, partial [Xanthomonas arboricola]|uniref:DUF2254 family protein n=1 Tax=Xanthomonas arboricola TaxID=56448 RepID=UPI001E2B0E49